MMFCAYLAQKRACSINRAPAARMHHGIAEAVIETLVLPGQRLPLKSSSDNAVHGIIPFAQVDRACISHLRPSYLRF